MFLSSNPKFVTEQTNYDVLYRIIQTLRHATVDMEASKLSGYMIAHPVDHINWAHLYSVLAYLRLNNANGNAGWGVYFQLYEDDDANLSFFQKEYEVFPFCDCSSVKDAFEFYEIDESQQEKVGSQWSIQGAEDHIVFSKDGSWVLFTNCTKEVSTLYFKPNSISSRIAELWGKEFQFEIDNYDI